MFIFQLTRPRKARHNSLDFTVRLHLEFQLTRPRKARLQGLIGSTASWNFNSRAHARRDALKEAAYRLGYISTHAPTQGATSSAFSSSDLSSFQLTRPRKARLTRALIVLPSGNFNSRAHARRDSNLNGKFYFTLLFQLTRPRKARLWSLYPLGYASRISTHAPTQGATKSLLDNSLTISYFNSRAHARRDYACLFHQPSGFYFNSRAHARRDKHSGHLNIAFFISTHAPTQGATSCSLITIDSL